MEFPTKGNDMYSPPVSNQRVEFPATLPQTSSDVNDAKTIKESTVEEGPSKKKQKLALHSSRRASWAERSTSTQQTTDQATTKKLAWIREIQAIKAEKHKPLRLAEFSIVATKILECKETLVGDDLLDLIKELKEVFNLLPDTDSKIFAFELLIRIAKAVPAEPIGWQQGVTALMSCLKSIYVHLEKKDSSHEYFLPLIDSLDRLIEMVETMLQDHKTLRASIAIIVIQGLGLIQRSESNLERFNRVAKMFAHREIDDPVKKTGFLALLRMSVILAEHEEEEEGWRYEEPVQSFDLTHPILSEIIETMNDKSDIQELQNAQDDAVKNHQEK